MYRYTPSFVISSSYRKIFFIGYITKALSSVYYDEKVGDVKGSIDEVIKERISSLNEDNNSSYFSCVGDWHMSRGLFDQDDLDRFPPHTCVYTVHDAVLVMGYL